MTFLAAACSQDDLLDDYEQKEKIAAVEEIVPPPDVTIMKNPYTIANMQAAYSKVLSEMKRGTITGKKWSFTAKGNDTVIIPNYLYLRFDPNSLEQELTLKEKSNILVLDYPFEYESWEDYHKVVPAQEGKISSYWASLPIDQKLPPSIPVKILEKMYIPDKDPAYISTKGTGKPTARGMVDDKFDFMNHVIEEAFVATDNEDLIPPVENTKGASCQTCLLGINLRGEWRPAGNLKIWDDMFGTTQRTRKIFVRYEEYDCGGVNPQQAVNANNLNAQTAAAPVGKCQRPIYRYETYPEAGSYIPFEGVNVLVRNTWTLDSDITDNKGDFSFKELRAKVKYVIQWDRSEFSIKDKDGLTQAEDAGPKLYREPWNKEIRGGREQYRGHIFQAALDFYYHDIGGLTRPPENGFFKTQLKIAAAETDEKDSFHAPAIPALTTSIFFLSGGGLPRIWVRSYGKNSESVYGITIH